MGTGVVLVLVVMAGAALFALAWWSSGRSKGRLGRASRDHEAAKNQALTHHHPHDASGGGLF
jgi:hypothetical protein